MTADDLITALSLEPHPEGGFYRQTWAGEEVEGRPIGTCIYFLLRGSERSHWHMVDAAEMWLYHAGAPLILSTSKTESGPAQHDLLGPDIAAGQLPQRLVPPHYWQAARSTGDYTLVSCTVTPGFQFEHFKLAPEGFDIP